MGVSIFMTQATVTSKGQVTIPASVRANMNVGTGDKIDFIDLGNGKYELVAVTRDISSLKGFVRPHSSVSIDEMNMAIANNAAS
jgi:AbrB family looped-hinge helix DNA binding protein